MLQFIGRLRSSALILTVGLLATVARAEYCETVSIREISQTEAFAGVPHWYIGSWIILRKKSEAALHVIDLQRQLADILESRKDVLSRPIREDLEETRRRLLLEMNRAAAEHNHNLGHYPDNFVVAASWRNYRDKKGDFEEYTARYVRALTADERQQWLADLQTSIDSTAEQLNEARLAIIKSSDFWEVEVRAAWVERPANGEMPFLQIMDERNQFYTWRADAKNPVPRS